MPSEAIDSLSANSNGPFHHDNIVEGELPTVFVGDTFTVGDITYKITSIDDLEVEVSDRATSETDITIPATIANPDDTTYDVIAIGEEAFKEDDIVSVSIPSSVVIIFVLVLLN